MKPKTIETIIQMSQNRVEFEQTRFKYKKFFEKDDSKDEIVNQLKTKGFYTIKNYYNKELCKELISEIENIQEKYKNSHNIRIMQQDGKGKGDAVRKGYAEATGDILMILDYRRFLRFMTYIKEN